jgi:hypothetical protein
VVRPAAGGPPAQEDTRVYDYGYEGGAPAGDEAVWHVVINQDQVGPMTVADVQQRYAAGEIDAETYAWREGFSDWLPLAQVDTFAAFVMAGGGASTGAHGGGGGADAVSSMFGTTGIGEDAGTMRSDPGDLFAAASASSRRADDDGGDLFGEAEHFAGGAAAAREVRSSATGTGAVLLNNPRSSRATAGAHRAVLVPAATPRAPR